MITEKTIISGTEEELLEYFKKKYNLIESDVVPDEQAPAPVEQNKENVNPDPHYGLNFSNKPAPVGQTGTTGVGNLFGGTSWGN